jgi:hypothetical protein
MGDAATQAAVAIAVQEIERRIATATPPNRLTTQRRLLQRAGGDAYGCSNETLWAKANLTAALGGLTLRFLGVVRSVGPAEKCGRFTLDIRGAKDLHQGRS